MPEHADILRILGKVDCICIMQGYLVCESRKRNNSHLLENK